MALAWHPLSAQFLIAPFGRRPRNPMGDFCSACRLMVGLSMVERIPEYLTRVWRQTVADRRRKIFVACIGHTGLPRVSLQFPLSTPDLLDRRQGLRRWTERRVSSERHCGGRAHADQ